MPNTLSPPTFQTDPKYCPSHRVVFGYQTYRIPSIYKIYIFIYNPNSPAKRDQSNFAVSILIRDEIQAFLMLFDLSEKTSVLFNKPTKNMKKVIYALILPLVVVCGLAFANREIKNEPVKKLSPKSLSAAEMKAGLKKWEASPDGIKYKKWEASAEGKKVYANADKIRKYLNANTNMEAVIISLSPPLGSPGNYCVLVRISGEDYLLNNDPKELPGLKVNDKIIIRSHAAGYASKYPYLIIWGDYIELNGKIVYKRAPKKGGC